MLARINNAVRPLFQFQRGVLFQYGWLLAWWRGRPVDRHGKPMPWLTYPAIDFLSQFDFTGTTVFEWGSGFSTLWWAERCARITTVESNKEWIPYIRPMLPPNVTLIETPRERNEEVNAISRSPDLYNVIVVDNYGPFRWECAKAAIGRLAPGGIIILDNSDQAAKAWHLLRDAGLHHADFTGYPPGGGYAHTTSIFWNERLDFPIAAPRSVAQPNPPWTNS